MLKGKCQIQRDSPTTKDIIRQCSVAVRPENSTLCRWQHWRIFFGNGMIYHKHRRNIASVYEEKYDRNLLKGPCICYYCGLLAQHGDHVPPISKANKHSGIFLVVWACKECNLMLKAYPLYTIRSRCEFLKKKYRKRYSKVLKIPDWNERELSEVGKSLKKFILKGILSRDNIRTRLCCIEERIQTEKGLVAH